MRLAINLAARGRPEHLEWTLRNTLPHLRGDTFFMVSLDEDDPETHEVAAKFPVKVSIKPREDTIAEKWNRVLLEEPADLYMPMTDYCPHITPGFDLRIVEAAGLFEDGIGVVYNHMANLSFPGLNVLTAGLVEKLGYVYPPYFPYWFVDHWIDDIARMIDRISFADVQISAAKNRKTHEFREPFFWGTFYDAMALMRREQALSIINGPDFHETEAKKERLRRNFPLHEHRSQWINGEVRRMGPGLVEDGGDRYARIKAQAQAMLKREIPKLEKDWEHCESRIAA